MEKLLQDFNLPPRDNAPEEREAAQRKWRKAVSLIKNSRRRFRHIPDLDKREKTKKTQNFEKDYETDGTVLIYGIIIVFSPLPAVPSSPLLSISDSAAAQVYLALCCALVASAVGAYTSLSE